MENPIHRFHDLFAQLGLSPNEVNIEKFIAQHSPLASDVNLPDAAFWTRAQTTFLREALTDDSDWSELVDQLSEALRGPERE